MADTTFNLADLHLQLFQSATIQYEVPFTDVRYAKVASCVFKEKGRSDALHILVSSLTEATKQAIWTVNFRMTDDGQYTLDETSSFLQYSREYWHPEDFYLCYSPDPAHAQCNIELYFKHERGDQAYRFVALTVLSDVDRTTPTDWTFHNQTYESSLKYLPVDGWTRVSTVTDAPVKIQYPRLIDGINFDGSSNIFHFGYSNTEPGTKIKLVSCPGFTLTEGAEITVFFSKSNTAESPSLDVEGTGAKPIYRDGEIMPAGEIAYETVLRFVYYKNRWNAVSHANGKGILYHLADDQEDGLFSAANKRKFDSVEWNANYYILPPATKLTLGGVKIGSNLTIQTDGTLSLTSDDIASALGYVPTNIDQIPVGATALPLVAKEEAKVGSSNKWAREDHIHPIQTYVPGNAGSATTVKQTAVAVETAGTIPKYPLLLSAIPIATSRTSGSNESVLYDLATSVTGRGDLELGHNLLVSGGEIHIAQTSASAGRLIFDQASSKKGVEIIEQDGVLTFQGVAPATTGIGTPLVVNLYTKTITGGYAITGTLKGNADTATKFESAQMVKITGAATGQVSSQAGWTIDITLKDSGVSAGKYGQATDVNVGSQDTSVSVSIPYITVDSKGLITSLANHTFSTPAWYTSTPKEVALTGSAGSSRTFAKGDHVHAFPSSGVSAGEYGPTANSTPGFGETFKVPYYKVDDFGRVTKAATYTTTIPATLATPAVIGLVSTGTQSFAGNKTFNGTVTLNQNDLYMTVKDTEGNDLRTASVLHANSSNSQYGINVALGGGGNAIVGGGESYSAQLGDLAGNAGEDLYLVSDGAIYFKTNGNTWTNAKTVTLDGSSNLSGLAKVTATTFQGALTGNADTATKLKNARTIWGQSFDGSGNISGAMTSVGTITYTPSPVDTTTNLIYSGMAASDHFKIAVGGASNAGWVEIATGDDGDEPIYVRQYKANNAVNRQITLLDGSGNSIFPGTVTATKFSGPLTGNVTGSLTVPAGGAITVPANATLSGNLSGNATTATKLSTARQINGTNFDGTANITTANWGTARTITIKDADNTNSGASVSVNGSQNYVLNLPSTIKASLTGNAATASQAASLHPSNIGNDAYSDVVVISASDKSTSGTANRVSTIRITNGDGYNELLLGAHNESNGAPGGITLRNTNGVFTVTLPGTTTGTFKGNLTGNVTGNLTVPSGGSITVPSNATLSGNLNGNASTATKLATARKINGVNFDGSADITVSDNTKLPLTGGTLTGDVTIQKANPILYLRNTSKTRGTAPSATIGTVEVNGRDSANKNTWGIYQTYTTDRAMMTYLITYKGTTTDNAWTGLGIGYDGSGNIVSSAPTPAVADNSTKIATTAWVRTATGDTKLTAASAATAASCTGNAATATKFASAQSVTLTGDITGTASSQAGWSIATTLRSSGVTAGDYGPTTNVSPSAGATFSIPYIKVDDKGRVIAAATYKVTLPTAIASTDEKVDVVLDNDKRVYIVGAANTTDGTKGLYCHDDIYLAASNGRLVAPTFVGDLIGDVTGNVTGSLTVPSGGSITIPSDATLTGNLNGNATTAGNVTGTVAIEHGGTGATTRLTAIKNLVNASVGTSATHFLTMANNWGQVGYTTTAGVKTVLGLKSAAYTESSSYASASHSHSNYAASNHSHSNYLPLSGGTMSGTITTNASYPMIINTGNASWRMKWSDTNMVFTCATYEGSWYNYPKTEWKNSDGTIWEHVDSHIVFKCYHSDSAYAAVIAGVSESSYMSNVNCALAFSGSNGNGGWNGSSNHKLGGIHVQASGTIRRAQLRVKECDSSTQEYAFGLEWGGEQISLVFRNASRTGAFYAESGGISIGTSGHKWETVYSTTATINTSDARKKDQIALLPDEVLDAWDSINWKQFKLKDSIAEKGVEAARTHTGIIAQEVQEVFAKYNLDPSKYGFFCHDEWDEAPDEVVNEHNNEIYYGHPAGDIYSIRYEEALCIEAAYQRRRANRLERRVEDLEAKLTKLEALLSK